MQEKSYYVNITKVTCCYRQMWKDYEEPKEEIVEEPTERKANFRGVCVTEVTPQLRVYCQFTDEGGKLDMLTEQVFLGELFSNSTIIVTFRTLTHRYTCVHAN